MGMRSHPISTTVVLVVVLLLAAGAAQAQEELARGVTPIDFGDPFPALGFTNLNPEAGIERVDLGQVLGTKPIVLVYWIAGHERAEQILLEVQSLVDEIGKDKIALYGVAIQRPGRDAAAIAARTKELGIHVPVLDDDGFRVGQLLRVQSVPSVALLDREGRLRLANGAALSQVLGYKVTLGSAIRSAATSGSVGTYGYLPTYYPVEEMVGKHCPDFTARLLSTSAEQSLSSMLKSDELNVLIFWSVECPHCRKSLPEINQWLKKNGKGVNVLSAANISSDAVKTKTKEFCAANDLVFPTLIDENLEISQLYQVTATPTILIIRPDGVIDSVLTSSSAEFGPTIEKKKRELVGS